jgi:hypothetical protein
MFLDEDRAIARQAVDEIVEHQAELYQAHADGQITAAQLRWALDEIRAQMAPIAARFTREFAGLEVPWTPQVRRTPDPYTPRWTSPAHRAGRAPRRRAQSSSMPMASAGADPPPEPPSPGDLRANAQAAFERTYMFTCQCRRRELRLEGGVLICADVGCNAPVLRRRASERPAHRRIG